MKANCSALALIFMFVGTVVSHAQQASAPRPNATNYTWHGELVSWDQTRKTVTVKASVVATTVAEELKKFKAGERAILHWSGFDNAANGVRGVMRYDAAGAAKDQFLLPVELVSPAVENSYLSFKLRTPDAAASVLQGVKAGEWVTITSKHRPAADADAFTAVRPYVHSDKS
jgi:hypothetical protein